MKEEKTSVQKLTYIGFFAAIIAASAQLAIPMPSGAPLTLQTLAIMFSGIVLGPKNGTAAVLVYALLGLIGVPVFAGLSGGPGVIFGRTGGFILSFPILALCAGVGVYKDNKLWLLAWLLLGASVNFLSGALMFGFVTGNGLLASFLMVGLPFIPTELIKIGLATAFGKSINIRVLKGFILAYLVIILTACVNSGEQPTVIDMERVEKTEEAVENLKPGEITTFRFRRNEFQHFLEEPSIENLFMLNERFGIYRKSHKAGHIQGFEFNHNNVEEIPSGYERLGAWPLYIEFIDFMEEENLRSILSERDIENEILFCTAVAHTYWELKENELPPPGTSPGMCIWIHTVDGDYFLEHNASLSDNPHDPNFTFSFYTLEEYRQKYGR